MGTIVQDVRHAIRSLSRVPGFTAVAVLTIALGIGANTAVFSVVNAVLLRPLPYANPEGLVTVWPAQNFNKTMLLRTIEEVPALASASGISLWTLTVTGDGGEPAEIEGALVSASHFDVLGVHPAIGRSFSPDEGRPGNAGVAVLSHGLWMARYGGDPAILGRSIRVSGAEYDERMVIGVMPAGYRPVVGNPQVWIILEDPVTQSLADDQSWYVNWRVARLASGATREQAEAQMLAAAVRFRAEVPTIVDDDDVRAASIEPLRAEGAGDAGPMLWLLFAAVGLVLLIACANVANLLLARGEARAREIAVRRALGARGGRILRQLLTESLVLGLFGGTAGVTLGWVLVRAIVMLAPPALPHAATVTIDGTVLLFALVASVIAAVFFGVAPAARAGRDAAARTLRQGRGAVGVRERGGMSSGLVVAEVALAVLLVAGAGLMLRSLQKLHAVHPGFDAAGVLTLRANPPAWRYGGLESQRAFHATALERVRALPGVASAGGIQLLPVSGGNWSFPTYPEGNSVPDGTAPPSVNFRVITPSYIETMAIPLIRGRTFSTTDRADGARVTLVNRAFVERFWPGLEPLGRTIRTFDPASTPYTVVGVIGDVHQFALDRAPRPELYVPHEQLVFEASLSYVVRVSDGDPAAHAAAVRDAIWGLDRDVPVSALETMTSVIGRSAETTRFLTVLLGVFGGLALVLGAVGVYGVTAYTVARRVPEFGVRLALGASAGDVMQISLLRGFRPVFAGVLLGTAGALIGTRWIQSLLFGVSPHDPLAIAGGGLVLGAVGFIATLLPAWRATRIDPAAVLRAEG